MADPSRSSNFSNSPEVQTFLHEGGTVNKLESTVTGDNLTIQKSENLLFVNWKIRDWAGTTIQGTSNSSDNTVDIVNWDGTTVTLKFTTNFRYANDAVEDRIDYWSEFILPLNCKEIKNSVQAANTGAAGGGGA